MKKIIAICLIAALALTAIPVMSFAAELTSMLDYDGSCYGALDNVFIDNTDEFMGGFDGAGRDYLTEIDGTIRGEHSFVMITGWVAFDQPIKGYGYQIDGGDVVMVEDAIVTAGQDVLDAAASQNCDYATRMKIRIELGGLLGTHTLVPTIRVEDGKDYSLALFNQEIEITYEGPADPNATPTPEPEATPEGEAGETEPVIFLLFDEDDKYGDIFTGGNMVEVGDFDEEKKCQILNVSESTDPYIAIAVVDAVDEVFGEEIDLDAYKFVQLGVRINPEACNSNGQIYFTTSEDPSLGERQCLAFQYKKTDEFQIVTINFSRTKSWTGILNVFRYDVFGTATADSDAELYYIAFFKTKEVAEAFAAEYTEKGADAFPEVATPTPKPTNTPTPEPVDTPTDSGNEDNAQAPTAAPSVTETPDTGKKKGCGSVVLGGAAVAAMMGAALILLKKKH